MLNIQNMRVIKDFIEIKLSEDNFYDFVKPNNKIKNIYEINMNLTKYYYKRIFSTLINIKKEFQYKKIDLIIEEMILLLNNEDLIYHEKIFIQPEIISWYYVTNSNLQIKNSSEYSHLIDKLFDYIFQINAKNIEPYEIKLNISDSHKLIVSDEWYKKYYPSSIGRAGAANFEPTQIEIEEIRTSLFEGLDLLRKFWNEALFEVNNYISKIILLRNFEKKFMPMNYSVHSFRNVVAIAPRPSYFSAQTLIHEAGHNKFSSVFDIYKLYNDNKIMHSPFVNLKRPIYSIFHGIISFMSDVHISQILLNYVKEYEGYSMIKYINKNIELIDLSIDAIIKNVDLTKYGKIFIEGIIDFRKEIEEKRS